MSRKNLIQLMTVIVILLGAVALFLAVRYFQNSQAPTSGEAATGNLACGSACTADSDCTSPSATGATVKCISGTCVNQACPTQTKPGSNCDCDTLNACGQPCGRTVGLCQSGSSCGFTTTPSNCNNIADNNLPGQYCLPNNPTHGYTLQSCTGIATSVLVTSTGQYATTQAQVLEACAAEVCGDGRCAGTETAANCSSDCTVCGDSLCTGTETNATCASDCPASCGDGLCGSTETSTTCAIDCSVCGDGICNGSETTSSCTADCKLPVTGVLDDGLAPIIFGSVFILLGVSLTRRNTFRFFNFSKSSKNRSEYESMVDSWINNP